MINYRGGGKVTVTYYGPHGQREQWLANTSLSEDTKYIWADLGFGPRLLALSRSGNLNPGVYWYTEYWVHLDHLGSVVKMTDISGSQQSLTRYKAYGEWRQAQAIEPPPDLQFTGQYHDQATGLYWYGSRYYNPGFGRFLQPDTVVPDPANPQALNRYSYALNNPLRYTDPTGHYTQDELAQYLGENWEERYFSDNGLFGRRERFVDYLRSDKATDLWLLGIMGNTFNELTPRDEFSLFTVDMLRRADAVLSSVAFSPRGASAGGYGFSAALELVINLTGGHVSAFLAPGASASLGLGVQVAQAQSGAVFNLPSNDSYSGTFWGVGLFAGILIGPTLNAFRSPSADLTAQDLPTGLASGTGVGLGFLANFNMSAYLEVYRWSAAGGSWFPTSFGRFFGPREETTSSYGNLSALL